MGQNVSGKPHQLPGLIGTSEADHDTLCAGSNKRLEPCDAMFRRARTETVPSRLLLIRDPVVAFNERAQFAFCLDDIGVDVERSIYAAMEVLGVSPHLLPEDLETLPIRRKGVGRG